MALTTIPSELSSVSGIADSSDATAITIAANEDITLAGHLHMGSGKDITAPADLILDVVGNIKLDADGGNVYFDDAATSYGLIFKDSTGLTIKSVISDGDFKIQGNDGGSTINALTFDMSEGGDATFAGNVGIGATPKTWNSSWESLQIGERSVFFSQASTTTGIGENVYYDAGGWKAFATATGSLYQLSGGNHHFYTMASVSADATSSPSEKFTILNNGKVGIGINSPSSNLHVKGTGETQIYIDAATNNNPGVRFLENGANKWTIGNDNSNDSLFFYDFGASATRVAIDSAGTLRVGSPAGVPTPTNGWDANLDAIQVGEASAFRSGDSDYSAATVVSTNIYQTGGADKLLNGTDLAAQYLQQGGNHYFYGYNNGSADATPAVDANDLANPVIIHKGGGISIGGGSVANTANGKAGIFWHGNPQNGGDYCIRRTNDAWSNSNSYAQLLIDWDTGVKIDVGNAAYGKSYLEVNGPITTFADGYTTHDYDDLVNATTRGISVNLHPSLACNGSAIDHCDNARNLGLRALVHQSTTSSTNRPTGYGTIWCDQHYYSDLNKGGKYVMQKCVGHSSTPLEYRRNTDTGSGTSWSSWYTVDHTITSDVRAKKNIVDAPDQLENLKKIRVRKFDFINDLDPNAQLGMIAQELDTTLPEYVWKQEDKDTGEVIEDLMWRIRYKDMIPMLIKSIQEQQTLIETLQTKVAALEAK